MRVGVIAIQGAFVRHISALERLNIPGLTAHEVRTPEELATVDRVIIPGGESTTVGMLMTRFGLADALTDAAAAGMPIWGTCMGMILMAHDIEDRPNQFSLNLLDVTVRRNAFGGQVHSFEDEVNLEGLETPVLGVFIRAPVVTRVGGDTEVLARYADQVVAVRSGNRIGTSFHPELTDDTRLHRWFVGL